MIRAGFFHLAVNRARHDVARRERFQRMNAVHEFRAVEIFQNAAFAAHGFGNQKRFRFRMIQTRRMKLHEFHVRDARARAIRHRHAVARRDVGIRRVEINFAAAAGRQQRHRRGKSFHAIDFFVENVSAETTVFCPNSEFEFRIFRLVIKSIAR